MCPGLSWNFLENVFYMLEWFKTTMSCLLACPHIWILDNYFKPVMVQEQSAVNFKDEGKEEKLNPALNLGTHFSWLN